MNLCSCERPIVDVRDASCALCGRTTVAALEVEAPKVFTVCPHDVALQRHRKAAAYYARLN